MMKKYNKMHKIITSFTLVLCLIIVSITQVFAVDTRTTKDDVFVDSKLSQKLEKLSNEERIDVSVWVKGINQNKVKERTKAILREENNFSDNKLEIIDTDFSNSKIESVDVETISRIDKTISVDDSELIIEKKREIASQMYEESNSKIFDSLNIDDKNLIYSCKYAPNILMSLTKDEINNIRRNNQVTEIYYYDRESESLNNESNFDSVDIEANTRNIYIVFLLINMKLLDWIR